MPFLAPQPQTRTATCTCRVNGGQILEPCAYMAELMALIELADRADSQVAFTYYCRRYSAHLRAANEGRG